MELKERILEHADIIQESAIPELNTFEVKRKKVLDCFYESIKAINNDYHLKLNLQLMVNNYQHFLENWNNVSKWGNED